MGAYWVVWLVIVFGRSIAQGLTFRPWSGNWSSLHSSRTYLNGVCMNIVWAMAWDSIHALRVAYQDGLFIERMCEELSSAEQWYMCKVWKEEIDPRMVTEVVRIVCILTTVGFVAQYGSRSICLSRQWSEKTCLYPNIILGTTKCNIANSPNGTVW